MASENDRAAIGAQRELLHARHAGTGEVVFPLQANRSTVVEALGTPSARKGFHSASYR